MTGKLFKPLLIMILGLCAPFLLLAGGTALAVITPVQITSDSVNEGRPDVHDNAIVWKRLSPTSGWDIYRANSVDPVTDAPGDQLNPVTNGIYIIWEDWSSGSGDIRMKSALPLSSEIDLVTGTGNQAILSVSGNRLVYVNNTNPLPCLPDNPGYPNCPGTGENDVNNDIYAVDLDNPNNPYPVCTEAGSQWQPRISGNKVVWQDYRNDNWDIYMKEITASGNGISVTTDPGSDKLADISRDIVVWRSNRNSQYDIWMKDISPSGGDEAHVTNDAAYQNSPRISGDLVVWEDYRNDSNPADNYPDYDIYMKDLTSGVESMLAGGYPIQARPAVDNETVVWEQNTTSGDYDIWMATVPDLTPPEISGLTPSAGQHTECDSLVLRASYSDNRVGVDAASVNLSVDGEDVTALSTINADSIVYSPAIMASGQHSATLTVADLSGNSASSSWQFDISQPTLSLIALGAYWDSYADYSNNLLSVKYQLFNPSAMTANYSVHIQDSRATDYVILNSEIPVFLGDIAPGGRIDAVLKYQVFANTAAFKATVYASCLDACGASYFFPGPPPE